MENLTIKWQAPEYKYTEKKADWFWAVWIIALSISIASIIYQNILFAVLIIIGSFTLVMYALRKPKMTTFGVSSKGLQIADAFYPYRNLRSFWISDDDTNDKKLLILSNKILSPLISIPLENVDIDKIREILLKSLEEEETEEPLSYKIMEYLGF